MADSLLAWKAEADSYYLAVDPEDPEPSAGSLDVRKQRATEPLTPVPPEEDRRPKPYERRRRPACQMNDWQVAGPRKGT